MIIYYDLLEKVFVSLIHKYTKDIRIHSLHITYNNRFFITCHFDYKGVKSSLKSYFNVDIKDCLVIKDIQGSIQYSLIKLDMYAFLKEILKNNDLFTFDQKEIFISLDKIPVTFFIKEATKEFIYLDLPV